MAASRDWSVFRSDEDPPSSWTRVCFSLPRHESTYELAERIAAIFGWLEDPDRVGEFAWKIGYLDIIQRGECVAFSDPDTAFEFKLKWG